jgi:hypothetical protein
LAKQRLVHHGLVNRGGEDIVAQFYLADDLAIHISQRN